MTRMALVAALALACQAKPPPPPIATQLRSCYGKPLVRTDPSRTIKARFTIDAAGKVVTVSATGLGDRDAEICVEEVLLQVRFPAGSAGVVEVSYPIGR